MQTALMAVASFHEKMGVSQQQKMETTRLKILEDCSEIVLQQSEILEEFGKHDERYNRLHLIFEEAAELGKAMAKGFTLDPEDDISEAEHHVMVLDGLADLLYVVLGTAVVFDLPLVEGFAEVHRSNMTKQRQYDDPSGHRVRDKGPHFEKPNLLKVLQDYKNGIR
jgi:predicted HAD superfamily Cof-like phosphohydrolase